MKRLPVLFFIILLSGCVHAGPTTEAVVRTADDIFYGKLQMIQTIYDKAEQRETYGAYENALYAYDSILSICDKILRANYLSSNIAENIYPYYIAAAYRKSIITHRMVEGSIIKLYRQLQLYEDADKWLQQALTTISNLYLDKGISISPSQFGMLYFAKAYNRAGWAFAMLNGSSWKRYIIYPPSETMNMIDKCVADLKQMMGSYGFIYQKDMTFNYEDGVTSYLSSVPDDTGEFKTLCLCYDVSTSAGIKKVLSKQLEINAAKTIDLYYMPDVQAAIDKGRKVYSFEDFMKPESKEYTSVISRFLDQMEAK